MKWREREESKQAAVTMSSSSSSRNRRSLQKPTTSTIESRFLRVVLFSLFLKFKKVDQSVERIRYSRGVQFFSMGNFNWKNKILGRLLRPYSFGRGDRFVLVAYFTKWALWPSVVAPYIDTWAAAAATAGYGLRWFATDRRHRSPPSDRQPVKVRLRFLLSTTPGCRLVGLSFFFVVPFLRLYVWGFSSSASSIRLRCTFRLEEQDITVRQSIRPGYFLHCEES